MSVAIKGMGWITPLGAGTDEVWQRLMAGEQGEIQTLNGPNGDQHFYMPVPSQLIEPVGKMPRLRRSGKVSYLTTAAGLAALKDAGLEMSPEVAERTGLIFAMASGGVIYTRKFYEPIVAQGANSASPLLFPETVFNASASHLAAILGINGATYTLVGDASVGITALKQAEQLIESGEVDYCLVVGGEEVDWVLCEAYGQWRLVTRERALHLHARPPHGTMLAEGAAALLLAGEGRVRLTQVHDGRPFSRLKKAAAAMKTVLEDLTLIFRPSVVVSSANGTFVDAAEEAAITASINGAEIFCPKGALGEALGASALIQTIVAALALEKHQLPPTLNSNRKSERQAKQPPKRAVVSVLGFNQQATGLVCETSQPV